MQLCRKESKCTAGMGSMTDRCGVDTGSADLCRCWRRKYNKNMRVVVVKHQKRGKAKKGAGILKSCFPS